MSKSPLSLVLSPGGQIYIDRHPDNNEFLDAERANKIHALFDNDHAAGLLHLGVQDVDVNLPASVAFWQKFSRHFINELCVASAAEELSQDAKEPYPSIHELEDIIADSPFMKGAEYLRVATFTFGWLHWVRISYPFNLNKRRIN